MLAGALGAPSSGWRGRGLLGSVCWCSDHCLTGKPDWSLEEKRPCDLTAKQHVPGQPPQDRCCSGRRSGQQTADKSLGLLLRRQPVRSRDVCVLVSPAAVLPLATVGVGGLLNKHWGLPGMSRAL